MKDDFPKQIPVFPLSGVIYFPKTNLPLNIFEQRYINLVNDLKEMKLNCEVWWRWRGIPLAQGRQIPI